MDNPPPLPPQPPPNLPTTPQSPTNSQPKPKPHNDVNMLPQQRVQHIQRTPIGKTPSATMIARSASTTPLRSSTIATPSLNRGHSDPTGMSSPCPTRLGPAISMVPPQTQIPLAEVETATTQSTLPRLIEADIDVWTWVETLVPERKKVVVQERQFKVTANVKKYDNPTIWAMTCQYIRGLSVNSMPDFQPKKLITAKDIQLWRERKSRKIFNLLMGIHPEHKDARRICQQIRRSLREELIKTMDGIRLTECIWKEYSYDLRSEMVRKAHAYFNPLTGWDRTFIEELLSMVCEDNRSNKIREMKKVTDEAIERKGIKLQEITDEEAQEIEELRNLRKHEVLSTTKKKDQTEVAKRFEQSQPVSQETTIVNYAPTPASTPATVPVSSAKLDNPSTQPEPSQSSAKVDAQESIPKQQPQHSAAQTSTPVTTSGTEVSLSSTIVPTDTITSRKRSYPDHSSNVPVKKRLGRIIIHVYTKEGEEYRLHRCKSITDLVSLLLVQGLEIDIERESVFISQTLDIDSRIFLTGSSTDEEIQDAFDLLERQTKSRWEIVCSEMPDLTGANRYSSPESVGSPSHPDDIFDEDAQSDRNYNHTTHQVSGIDKNLADNSVYDDRQQINRDNTGLDIEMTDAFASDEAASQRAPFGTDQCPPPQAPPQAPIETNLCSPPQAPFGTSDCYSQPLPSSRFVSPLSDVDEATLRDITVEQQQQQQQIAIQQPDQPLPLSKEELIAQLRKVTGTENHTIDDATHPPSQAPPAPETSIQQEVSEPTPPTPPAPVKRGRGRPPGSRNKKTSEKKTTTRSSAKKNKVDTPNTEQ
ncbi:hypothetical protein BJ508DRAFT_327223 [Ascobolus immersus RN42]|uniref:Uncharacterized protein n=1 Tax=Ascobolus immersus RN42 TaxID=1160509 RepID=A0A3N4I321_ASCIM|nr:hypothetical protein BJ508DRAFT_327223 [Ascobolus immersus RN42]